MFLSIEKRKTLSGICRDVGQVALASVLVDPVARGNFNPALIILGSIFIIGFWFLSLYLIKS